MRTWEYLRILLCHVQPEERVPPRLCPLFYCRGLFHHDPRHDEYLRGLAFQKAFYCGQLFIHGKDAQLKQPLKRTLTPQARTKKYQEIRRIATDPVNETKLLKKNISGHVRTDAIIYRETDSHGMPTIPEGE
jgi:hypothetical protein